MTVNASRRLAWCKASRYSISVEVSGDVPSNLLLDCFDIPFLSLAVCSKGRGGRGSAGFGLMLASTGGMEEIAWELKVTKCGKWGDLYILKHTFALACLILDALS